MPLLDMKSLLMPSKQVRLSPTIAPLLQLAALLWDGAHAELRLSPDLCEVLDGKAVAQEPVVSSPGPVDIEPHWTTVLTDPDGAVLGEIVIHHPFPPASPAPLQAAQLAQIGAALSPALCALAEQAELKRQLERTRADAAASARAKSEFLATMSHELRTPLTAIIGYTRLLEAEPRQTKTRRNYIRRVTTAGSALFSTINDILEYARLEQGRLELFRRPTHVEYLARDVVELFELQAREKAISIGYHLVGDVPEQVNIDMYRVRQVLMNLIGNAVKFTDVGGVQVCLTYDHLQGAVDFVVQDTGPGISSERQDRLFQRTSQGDSSITPPHEGAGHEGAGLGLAFSRALIEAMGGRIGVRSTEGQGASFWFSIPAPVAREEDALPPLVFDPAAIPSGARILVVDDNENNRLLVRAILETCDVRLTEAESGEAAVELCARQPFDVVLMDLRMPGVDGVGATRRIREAGGVNAAVPVLAFSADQVRFADRAVFNGLITKPVRPDLLLSGLAVALSRSAIGAVAAA